MEGKIGGTDMERDNYATVTLCIGNMNYTGQNRRKLTYSDSSSPLDNRHQWTYVRPIIRRHKLQEQII